VLITHRLFAVVGSNNSLLEYQCLHSLTQDVRGFVPKKEDAKEVENLGYLDSF